MPTRRQERVARRIVEELVEAFRNLKNIDLGFVTVTKCEVSPDLRHAKVFVSVWGDEKTRERSLNLLKNNASRLRGIIGRPLGTKVVPSLHFEFDETIANADHISRLIRDARQTDLNPGPLSPEEEAELAAAAASVSASAAGDSPSVAGDNVLDGDLFDAARREVEEELELDDDDPDWRPINLDELPDE